MSKKRFILCEQRLPTENGEYDIRHNCGTKNGFGRGQFDVNAGWLVPDAIKSFFKVTDWFESCPNDAIQKAEGE